MAQLLDSDGVSDPISKVALSELRKEQLKSCSANLPIDLITRNMIHALIDMTSITSAR